MRYVPIEHIKEGMILGKTLYGEMGEILLREGSTIIEGYIAKIKILGYFGLYIEDELSEGICIKDVIDEDLKMRTIHAVKTMMSINRDNSKEIAKSYEEIENLVENIVEDIASNKGLIVNLIDLKVANNYTFYHSVNVTVLSLIIALAFDYNKNELKLLANAALLHDIGKMFTPPELLDKPGSLTFDEFEIIKKHPESGYNYIKEKLDVHTKTYMGILSHHERYNGTGYPNGVAGKDIPEFARIISVADVYDALTSDRPYRKRINPSEAMEYIMGGGGTFFDVDIVREFAKIIAPYPIGTCVKLTNDFTGIVVENYAQCCLRPRIKVFKEGNKLVKPYILDLKESSYNVTICDTADALSTEMDTITQEFF